MRVIPEAIESALASGAAKLCHVWIVRRTDDVRLGFTDHDRVLVFDGVECRADSGFSQGAVRDQAGSFVSGEASVAGVIEGDHLRSEDIAAGLFDGAEVRCLLVDWRDVSVFVELWVGRMARVESRGGVEASQSAFVAHIEGPLGRLERIIGRRFSSLCDAVLGDARCGVDIGDFAGTVCDKRYATCRDVFGNTDNFRGFPDMPGEDFLTVYPRSGDRMDGSSRLKGHGR